MPIIVLGEKSVPYSLRRSLKAKRLRLEYRLSQLCIVAPFHISNRVILQFLFQQKSWLFKQLAKSAVNPPEPPSIPLIKSDLMQPFKINVYNSVEKYSQLLAKRPKGVYLKTQKRRWGSCGIHDQIYINWALMAAPLKVIDYVVLHECCHLFHRNHGQHFWALVQKHMPDYKLQEKWLRDHAYIIDLHSFSSLACHAIVNDL